jgi:hypothetical protein
VKDNQAESAEVFAARKASTFVVGFIEVEGGEGSSYYKTAYLLIDPRSDC